MSAPLRKHKSAFTLFETLLGLLLIGVIGAGVVSYAWNMLRARDTIATTAERESEWSTLNHLLGNAVLSARARSSRWDLSGSSGSIRVPCEGMSFNPEGRLGYAGALELRFDGNSHSIVGSLNGVTQQIMGRVSAMTFRYWTGHAWEEQFGVTESRGLPGAIEVCVWYQPPDGHAEDPPSDSGKSPPDHWRIFAVPDGGTSGEESAP